MQDLRQTKEWANYLSSWGWEVEEVDCQEQTKARILIRKFPFTPVSFFKLQRFFGKPNLEKILEIKKRHRVVYSIIEPLSKEGILPGYRQLSSYYVPSKTTVIDLSKPINKIFSAFSKTTRNILYKTSSVKIIETDLKTFYPAWKAASKTYVPPYSRINILLSVFGPKAKLLISQCNGKPLSGLLLLSSKDTANYFYSWTNPVGRQKNTHYYLIWQTLQDAQKNGLKYFDFEGIFDSRFPNKKWLGFSDFKKKFGGTEISYPGCFGRWF